MIMKGSEHAGSASGGRESPRAVGGSLGAKDPWDGALAQRISAHDMRDGSGAPAAKRVAHLARNRKTGQYSKTRRRPGVKAPDAVMLIDAIDIYHVAHPMREAWSTAYGSDEAVHGLLVRFRS